MVVADGDDDEACAVVAWDRFVRVLLCELPSEEAWDGHGRNVFHFLTEALFANDFHVPRRQQAVV